MSPTTATACRRPGRCATSRPSGPTVSTHCRSPACGAVTVQIAGDFDDAMHRVQQVPRRLGIYLVNSVNPFRLEGQKTIMYRVLEALRWQPPDWVVVPGGNLGNVSAFGKAFIELQELGLLKRVPRLAVINAAGASTFYNLY